MARASFGRRRGNRRRPPYRWTGQSTTAEATLAAAAVQEIVIVAPSDYQASLAGTTEAGGCTVLRIRAGISLRATVVGALMYVGIFRKGSAEFAPNPNTAAALIDGDLMWYGCYMVPLAANAEPLNVDIDVRVKRKLEDDRIILVFEAAAQTVTYAMWARALLLNAA